MISCEAHSYKSQYSDFCPFCFMADGKTASEDKKEAKIENVQATACLDGNPVTPVVAITNRQEAVNIAAHLKKFPKIKKISALYQLSVSMNIVAKALKYLINKVEKQGYLSTYEHNAVVQYTKLLKELAIEEKKDAKELLTEELENKSK